MYTLNFFRIGLWQQLFNCPVGWGCRIHRIHVCRWVRPHQRVSWIYDTKKSDGEVLVMLELWGMRRTPSLQSLPGSVWPGVVAPDRALSMGQIELIYVLILNNIS